MDYSTLHLRKARQFPDLADQIAHLVWADLENQGAHDYLQARRFPYLRRLLVGVLRRNLDRGETCPLPAPLDSWIRIGHGLAMNASDSVSCYRHVDRLLDEARREIHQLFLELETAVCDFLGNDIARLRKPLTPVMKTCIHRAVHESVAPYLLKQIIASCCSRRDATPSC